MLPEIFTLTPYLSQEQQIQTLREYSKIAFKRMYDEKFCIRTLISTVINNPTSYQIL